MTRFPLFLISFFLFCSAGRAAAPETLSLAKYSDGKEALGAVYAYDRDFFWQVTFTTTLKSEVLTQLPNEIQWRVIDKKTHEALSGWFETEKSRLIVGQFKITKPSILWRLLPHQGDVELQFGTDSNGEVDPRYVLPLGDFCRREGSAQYFNNLTHSRPCFQISESDLRNHLVN